MEPVRVGYWRQRGFAQPLQPIIGVSWKDAVAFCEWLSSQWDRSVVLPTEAQWEFAARGTDGRIWPWGDEPPDSSRACFGRNTSGPVAVATLVGGRGPFGTFDQAGNVWEWCRDTWDENAYRTRVDNPEPHDPEVLDGDRGLRPLRGGSWFSDADWLRAAARYWYLAVYRSQYIGFRVALVPASTAS